MNTLLTLDASCKFLSEHRRNGVLSDSGVKIPRRVMQFWDKNPPDQIQTLLKRNQALCQKADVEYVFFDERTAREYLTSHGDRTSLAAYDIAVHPAMKCDVFRLAYLFRTGGHYIDADIVFRDNLSAIFSIPGNLLVYQWDTNNLSNLCNWLIGSCSGIAPMEEALARTSNSIISACERDPQAALRNILGVSGPGIFTRAIATSLSSAALQPSDANIQTVSVAHQFIQLGPAYLKSNLIYKSDARHWLTAGGPAEEAPTQGDGRHALDPVDREAETPREEGLSQGSWLSRAIGHLTNRKKA